MIWQTWLHVLALSFVIEDFVPSSNPTELPKKWILCFIREVDGRISNKIINIKDDPADALETSQLVEVKTQLCTAKDNYSPEWHS